MMRIPEPLQRGEERACTELLLRAPGDLTHEHRIGEYRHVPSVLFQRRDGEDDGSVPAQSGDIGPGEVLEEHDG